MLKRLARKILAKEIAKMEEKIKDSKEYADAYASRCAIIEKRMIEKDNKISMLQTDYDVLKRRNIELEEQNAALRQYYHLDEEPAQETIDKMYLDEKYREQEKELMQLRAYKEYCDGLRNYMMFATNFTQGITYSPYISQAWFPRLY